jgi:hypothetical protein
VPAVVAGVDDGLGPQLERPAPGGGVDVDRHHPRTGGHGHLHRRQPHAAAAVHREPLPCGEPAHRQQRPEGRREPAAEQGGRAGVDLVRQPHQVDRRPGDGEELGEGPPAGEAGLPLVLAHLLLPRPARRAGAAGQDERRGHPVADP